MEKEYDFITLVVSSLIFVVSLSWNTLINDAIDHYAPQDKKNITVKTIYTVILTLVVAFVATYLSMLKKPLDNFTKRIFSNSYKKLSQTISGIITVK